MLPLCFRVGLLAHLLRFVPRNGKRLRFVARQVATGCAELGARLFQLVLQTRSLLVHVAQLPRAAAQLELGDDVVRQDAQRLLLLQA